MNNLSINEIYNRENKPFEVDINEFSARSNQFYIDEQKVFELIVRGFFPILYADSNLKTQTFYSSYITTYLEKDLKEFISITDEVKFINFLKLLASNTGEELVYDNYSKQVGVATNTIKSWISILVTSGIIYLVEPYNEESVVKRVVKDLRCIFSIRV